MFTEAQKHVYLGQLNAFLHAHVDGALSLLEAKVKATGESVILACIVQQVIEPPRLMGGTPTPGERIIPIFQFVNPTADNPYESADPQMQPLAMPTTSGLVLPDA